MSFNTGVNTAEGHLHDLKTNLAFVRQNYWRAFWNLNWNSWRFSAGLIKQLKADILAFKKEAGLR